MKKIPCLVAALILTSALLAGCAAETKRTPIDCRYTEAYSSTETDYQYKYDFMNNRWSYLPEVRTVHHPEKYEILYLVEYDDGSKRNLWVEVSYRDYERFREDRTDTTN